MDKYEKLYNEALERFKSFKEKYYTKDTNLGDVIFDKNGEMQKDFNGIFPEPKESEDERIRAVILKLMLGMRDEIFTAQDELVTKPKVLAWLEKQKEPHYTKRNALFDKCVAECDPAVMKEVSDEIDEMLEKEQKSVYIEGYGGTADVYSDGSISCKQKQKPVDDSDFKYKLAEYMTKCCTKKEGPYGYEYGISAETILEMAKEELLKRGELKEQKPVEWSEEDEKIRQSIIKDIEFDRNYISATTGKVIGKYDEQIAWLKSLRSSWKPSEEQMEVLGRFSNPVLISLYEQLKRLKGGVAPMKEIDE